MLSKRAFIVDPRNGYCGKVRLIKFRQLQCIISTAEHFIDATIHLYNVTLIFLTLCYFQCGTKSKKEFCHHLVKAAQMSFEES